MLQGRALPVIRDCRRCGIALALVDDAACALCAPCLRQADADLALKRTILLPRAEADGDRLSAAA